MAAQFASTFGPSTVMRQVRREGKDRFSPDGKGCRSLARQSDMPILLTERSEPSRDPSQEAATKEEVS